MVSQKETITYVYLTDEKPVRYDHVKLCVDAKDTKMDKFKCVECGENDFDKVVEYAIMLGFVDLGNDKYQCTKEQLILLCASVANETANQLEE